MIWVPFFEMGNRIWFVLILWLTWLSHCFPLTEEEELELRENEEWKRNWHTERYRICEYDKIATFVKLACKNDIYKINNEELQNQNTFNNFVKKDKYLPISLAYSFGIKKMNPILKRRKRGITQECCENTAGCYWEELAEYCPNNIRRVNNRNMLVQN